MAKLDAADRSLIALDDMQPWQKAAIVALSEKHVTRATYDQISKQVGVDLSTLYRFRQRRDVQKALGDYAISQVYEHIPAAVAKTAERATKGKGNVKDAELLFKLSGLLVERRAVDANVTAEVNDVSDASNDALRDELATLRAKLGGDAGVE